MIKIPTLFQRDERTHQVIPVVTKGCEWVLDGLGIPTRKYDGMACMIRNGQFFKRLEVKAGAIPPSGWTIAVADEVHPRYEDIDLLVDDDGALLAPLPGWVPVSEEGPEDQWFRVAIHNSLDLAGKAKRYPVRLNGTYELVGPKVQGNPEGFTEHQLIRHGERNIWNVPLSFEGMRHFFKVLPYEGIVWHWNKEWEDFSKYAHDVPTPAITMVKLKVRDFGFKRASSHEHDDDARDINGNRLTT
jgi:hypothetical protein